MLKAFPGNAEKLLHLADDVMGGAGELTRGEREAIAAFVSGLNNVGYCVHYHTLFSEVFCGPIAETNQRLEPLMCYAQRLCASSDDGLDATFQAARDAGWGERALFEVVEICGLFHYFNSIVRAAGLLQPDSLPEPLPTQSELRGSYKAMAGALKG